MSGILGCSVPTTDPAQRIADEILDRPAVLFAGQGAQEAGMGRDLAEADKEAMDYWKKAETISGLPLREIYWEGNEQERNNTAAAQPALTVVNLNLWNAASRQGRIVPGACAGHSLGEFAALGASGVLSPDDVLRITSARGRLMAEADPDGIGAMAAIVKLPNEKVVEIVENVARESGEMIVAANFNTPVQTVISGTKKAVALANEKARALKGRALELNVSGAFHSPMMNQANEAFREVIEKATWHDPKVPVYTNAEAAPVLTGQQAKKSILRQMISPVFWVNLIRSLYMAGVRWWMEISPRAVLGKMIGPSLAGIAGQCDTLRVDLLNSLNSIAQAAL